MTESAAGAEKDAIRTWYTRLLDQVVKEMIRLKAVSGSAIQAAPVWMLPNEMLMAKVWAVESESDFVWTLSIDKMIADYIAGSLAATPRDAARHFSLKWQMDADRLTNFQNTKVEEADQKAQLQDYANRLVRHAELLYDLTGRDEAWEEKEQFAGQSTTKH